VDTTAIDGDTPTRYDRRQTPPNPDNRTPAQRDRDRILYNSAFRWLAGVTLVVAAEEGDVFHNRLTHSLKVAQFGRRLAEKLAREYDKEAEASSSSGLDPDIVEAACLAHDLGHPPFGHVAEEELQSLSGHIGSFQP
jgi:dGTPase